MKTSKSKKTLNICFLSHSSGIAGAEKAFPKLLVGLLESGIQIHVLLPGKGPIEEVLKSNQIDYKVINYSRWLNSDSFFLNRIKRTVRNLFMVIPVIFHLKKQKCNLVYTNTSTVCTGAFAAKLLGLPHVWHFREFGSEDYGYDYDIGKMAAQYLTNKLSTICLANSYAVSEKYKTFVTEEKLKVIYECYDIEEESINTENHKFDFTTAFNCIIVGTLHEAKGHKDALMAISELLKIGRNINLHIIGSGFIDYKNQLYELISKLSIKQSVFFHGYIAQPISFMRKCDLLLMCSRSEAFGLVTLEAMQIGIPVIGTRSGGTVELVIDYETGFLYNPGDYIELSRKIDILYNDRSKAKEMGLKGKQRANKHFKFSNYVKETIKLIEQFA